MPRSGRPIQCGAVVDNKARLGRDLQGHLAWCQADRIEHGQPDLLAHRRLLAQCDREREQRREQDRSVELYALRVDGRVVAGREHQHEQCIVEDTPACLNRVRVALERDGKCFRAERTRENDVRSRGRAMHAAANREVGDQIVVDGDRGRRSIDRGRREADLSITLHDAVIHRPGRDAERSLSQSLRVGTEVLAPNEEAECTQPEEEYKPRRENARILHA